MIQRLPLFAHIWLLARVYPFSSVWLGDLLYSELTGRPFEPLHMLPLKLFCVATIAFPFLVLSGSARILLRNPTRENKAGLITAAVVLVIAFASLQGAILHAHVTRPEQELLWSAALVYSPVYMLLLIPAGIFAGRRISQSRLPGIEPNETLLDAVSDQE
jgi:hypothetical protein